MSLLISFIAGLLFGVSLKAAKLERGWRNLAYMQRSVPQRNAAVTIADQFATVRWQMLVYSAILFAASIWMAV